MEVILLQDIDKVGGKFELVKVKDGYGRNYLIPQGLAIIANSGNMKRLEEFKRREQAKLARELHQVQELAEKLKDTVLKIPAKAGVSGKIFGSVTSVQIAAALREALDVEIERRKIKMPEEVKTLGTYTAVLELHPDVDTSATFEVFAE